MRIDIKVNEDRMPIIKDGDFVLGESDFQHVKDILEFRVGDIPQFPTLGTGISLYIQSTDRQKLIRDIIAALSLDKYNFGGFDRPENGNTNVLFSSMI